MKTSREKANDVGAPARPATPGGLPERIEGEAELDDLLTRPSAALVEAVRNCSSPLVILGAGGKMGPTLAVRARRAAEAAGHPLEVVAVSRFSHPGPRDWLEARGVRTLSCDLLDEDAGSRLPDSVNVVSLVGLKFGTTQNPAATWALNTLVPVRVCQRYPHARVVALSTGNVYPPSPASEGGSEETAHLTPVGEYANSAVARERLFEHGAQCYGTRVALVRLFYAVELRYGVLVDIARKVLAGTAIDLGNGRVNWIWQGDANDAILRLFPLAATPPSVWNLCRPEACSVREVAGALGQLLGRAPVFSGREQDRALLGNPARLQARLGMPALGLEPVLRWIAAWVQSGGRDLGRPTHFETRDGRY